MSVEASGKAKAQGAPGLPNVRITSPVNGSTIEPGDIEVRIDVDNFDLATTRDGDPGDGFVYFYRDVKRVPTTPGRSAAADDPALDKLLAKTAYTWPDVEPGTRTFAVQLVGPDRRPLEPPITSQTQVEVTEAP